jgi:hypothetical protein
MVRGAERKCIELYVFRTDLFRQFQQNKIILYSRPRSAKTEEWNIRYSNLQDILFCSSSCTIRYFIALCTTPEYIYVSGGTVERTATQNGKRAGQAIFKSVKGRHKIKLIRA